VNAAGKVAKAELRSDAAARLDSARRAELTNP
jgi:hypothetical protein